MYVAFLCICTVSRGLAIDIIGKEGEIYSGKVISFGDNGVLTLRTSGGLRLLMMSEIDYVRAHLDGGGAVSGMLTSWSEEKGYYIKTSSGSLILFRDGVIAAFVDSENDSVDREKRSSGLPSDDTTEDDSDNADDISNMFKSPDVRDRNISTSVRHVSLDDIKMQYSSSEAEISGEVSFSMNTDRQVSQDDSFQGSVYANNKKTDNLPTYVSEDINTEDYLQDSFSGMERHHNDFRDLLFTPDDYGVNMQEDDVDMSLPFAGGEDIDNTLVKFANDVKRNAVVGVIEKLGDTIAAVGESRLEDILRAPDKSEFNADLEGSGTHSHFVSDVDSHRASELPARGVAHSVPVIVASVQSVDSSASNNGNDQLTYSNKFSGYARAKGGERAIEPSVRNMTIKVDDADEALKDSQTGHSIAIAQLGSKLPYADVRDVSSYAHELGVGMTEVVELYVQKVEGVSVGHEQDIDVVTPKSFNSVVSGVTFEGTHTNSNDIPEEDSDKLHLGVFDHTDGKELKESLEQEKKGKGFMSWVKGKLNIVFGDDDSNEIQQSDFALESEEDIAATGSEGLLLEYDNITQEFESTALGIHGEDYDDTKVYEYITPSSDSLDNEQSGVIQFDERAAAGGEYYFTPPASLSAVPTVDVDIGYTINR